MRTVRALLTVALLSVATLLSVGAAPASAGAPAGYFGPVTTCPGSDYKTIEIAGAPYIKVTKSNADGGSFCAKAFDNLAGSHYMSVSIQRTDWVTIWSDTGLYTTYAGGVGVKGVANGCAWVSGSVRIDGVTQSGGDLVCW